MFSRRPDAKAGARDEDRGVPVLRLVQYETVDALAFVIESPVVEEEWPVAMAFDAAKTSALATDLQNRPSKAEGSAACRLAPWPPV